MTKRRTPKIEISDEEKYRPRIKHESPKDGCPCRRCKLAREHAKRLQRK